MVTFKPVETFGEKKVREAVEADNVLNAEEVLKAKEYLASTDYCIVKAMEYGQVLSVLYPGLVEKRESARKVIRS